MADHHGDHTGALLWVQLTSTAMFFGFCCYKNWGVESFWLVLLFGLPLFVQAIGVVSLYLKPRKDNPQLKSFLIFYIATITYSVPSFCLLWLLYLSDYKHINWLSYLAVIIIILLIAPIVILTFALMNPPFPEEQNPSQIEKWLDHLRAGVSQMSFMVLLHSLTIFLSVSYLFGFAFAFHDRSVNETERIPPLYQAALPFQAKNEEPDNRIIAGTMPCYYLYFEDDRSELLKDNSDPSSPIIKKAMAGADREKVERYRLNYNNFEGIITELNNLSVKAKLIHINLIGHASDKKPGKDSAYGSNYQVSNARAQAIQNEITKEFYSRNENKFKCKFEWSIMALSNEALPQPNTLDEKLCNNAKRDDRMVQVTLRPVFGDPVKIESERMARPDFYRLDLMDYMYFSIYTITTTGYGDIVPTSTYAKFLTGLANICEVFFIVGFFNVLISFKENKENRGRQKEKQREAPPE